MKHTYQVVESSRDRVCFECIKEKYFENLTKDEFYEKMGKEIVPPPEWREQFEINVSVPLEKEALNPTDMYVLKRGLKVYESRMFVYTTNSLPVLLKNVSEEKSERYLVLGGALQSWNPDEGENSFRPAGSNFESIPTGYIRNYAHYHPKWPWTSQDDLNLLVDHIDGFILEAKAMVYAVSNKYVSYISYSNKTMDYGFWCR